MLFDTFETKGLLFNQNFKEGDGKYAAYRGDLVLGLGEIGDALGHRLPPTHTIKNTVVLSEDDKIKLFAGSLDDLSDLPRVVEYYKADMAADAKLIIFVVNIRKPLVVSLDGLTFNAVSLQEGLIWNELIDLAALEKGDFKGQSPLEKIVTVSNALKDYKSKGEQVDFEGAKAQIDASLTRAGRGPI